MKHGGARGHNAPCPALSRFAVRSCGPGAKPSRDQDAGADVRPLRTDLTNTQWSKFGNVVPAQTARDQRRVATQKFTNAFGGRGA